jgi:phosphoribosylaminoimidazole-succinocarboxamide synthase (EC 6.3.2.6)
MVDGKRLPRQRRSESTGNDSGYRTKYQWPLHRIVRKHHRWEIRERRY